MVCSGILERLVAGRWIAGPFIADAITRSKRINSLGIRPIINYLGEEFSSETDVNDAVATYIKLISEIRKSRIKADISLKASQLGLRISEGMFMGNYSRIVAEARRNNVFVWLDMESAADVDATISAYTAQLKSGDGVGICIQSYLKRSGSDIRSLSKSGAVIRLVKGAYSSTRRLAYQSRLETTANYARLMKYLFSHAKEFVIATHDPGMVSMAQRLNAAHRKHVGYAMLNGISNKRAIKLAREGNHVEIYVPFGTRWLSYSYRRLKEASNLSLVLRSVLGGG